MFRDPEDRYGLSLYRRVMLTGALAVFVILGIRLLRGIDAGYMVYLVAAVVLLLLGLFTEPVTHLIVGRRRDR